MGNITKTSSREEIVVYKTPDGTTSLDVRFENDSVWLTQDQLVTLFQRDKSVISRHIRDIFKEGELDPKVVVAKNATTTRHGAVAGKTQTHEKLIYNLDVIISVGYRVKSKRGTQFRIWASSVLKEFLIKGYAINPRLEQLERRVAKTEEKIDFFVTTSLPPVEGIFFEGQIYDAYEFICDLIKSAKTRIILIDNYVDDTVLTMLDKRGAGVHASIYTQKITSEFKLDIYKHNSQYPVIDVKEFKQSHDRFLIIDNSVYLIGASLKDAGKKWFCITRMDAVNLDIIISRLETGINPGLPSAE